MGIMAGLGEHCRAMHVITPEQGLRQRIFAVVTDLPLAPGKPVDFGVMRFCRVCKKCSDVCPPKAINGDTEPSWNILGDYQQAGIKSWHRIEPRCLSYIKQSGSSTTSSGTGRETTPTPSGRWTSRRSVGTDTFPSGLFREKKVVEE
jgi:ferredoxin